MFLEVSALTAYNVEDAFLISARQILSNIGNSNEQQKTGMTLEKDKHNSSQKNNCEC